SLIVRITQAEPDEREGIGAYEMFVARAVRADGTVTNGDIARGQRVRASTRVPGLRRRDARVVAVDSGEARELGVGDVSPALDVIVPCIGRLAQYARRLVMPLSIGAVRGDEQRRDLHGECERRVSTVLFPPILLGDRSVTHDEGRSLADHRPRIEILQF